MEIGDLANINSRTIEGKQQLLSRLDELSIGASQSDTFTIERLKAEVQQDLNLQRLIAQRLAAAAVTVRPLDSAETQQLNTLAQLVDQAIRADDIANADLALVSQLAAAAKGIGNILDRHVS